MKDTPIIFTPGSENVFKDLGFKNPESELLRAQLALEIHKIIKRRKLSQKEAAHLLSVDQPDISRIKNGKFERFKLERLLQFMTKLNRDVCIQIGKTSDTVGRQTITIQ